MKQSNLLFSAIVIIMIMFLGGCSKDDDTANPAQQNDPPVYAGKTVTPPDALMQSADPGAQETMMYINMANSFAGMAGSYMTPPGKSSGFKSTNGDGPPWVYSWDVNDESGTYTLTLTINENSEGSDWTMKVTGVMDGITLTNFTLVYGWQSTDGKSGNFTVYDWQTQDVSFTMSWITDENNIYTLTVEFPQESKIVIKSNPDNSGSIEFFEWTGESFGLAFNAVWNSSGHGEYWEYEGGELLNHGTW
jgi:hypothetical protein